MKFYKAHCILFSAMSWCFLTLECAQKIESSKIIRARFPELYDAMKVKEEKLSKKNNPTIQEAACIQLLPAIRKDPKKLTSFLKKGIKTPNIRVSVITLLPNKLTVVSKTKIPCTNQVQQNTTFKEVTNKEKITLEDAIAIFHPKLYKELVCFPESHPIYKKAPLFFEFLNNVELKKSAPLELKKGLNALIDNDICRLKGLAKSPEFLPVLDESFTSEKTHPFYSMTVRRTLKKFFPEISKLVEQFEQKEQEDRDTCFEPPSN